MGIFDFFSKKEHKEDLNKGLEKTKEGFFSKIAKAVAGKTTVDEDLLDTVEEALMSADVGLETVVKIIARIEKRVAIDKYVGEGQFMKMLKEEIQ